MFFVFRKYQLWKIRELKRIKRDREEEETHLKELLQIERRRQMTDEERREDDRRLDAKRGDQPKKGKYAFLQKYYHKVKINLIQFMHFAFIFHFLHLLYSGSFFSRSG